MGNVCLDYQGKLCRLCSTSTVGVSCIKVCLHFFKIRRCGGGGEELYLIFAALP